MAVTVLSSNGKKQTKAVMTTLDVIPKPNQRINKGVKEALGPLASNNIGKQKFSKKVTSPIRIPMIIPDKQPKSKPSKTSEAVRMICGVK